MAERDRRRDVKLVGKPAVVNISACIVKVRGTGGEAEAVNDWLSDYVINCDGKRQLNRDALKRETNPSHMDWYGNL